MLWPTIWSCIISCPLFLLSKIIMIKARIRISWLPKTTQIMQFTTSSCFPLVWTVCSECSPLQADQIFDITIQTVQLTTIMWFLHKNTQGTVSQQWLGMENDFYGEAPRNLRVRGMGGRKFVRCRGKAEILWKIYQYVSAKNK